MAESGGSDPVYTPGTARGARLASLLIDEGTPLLRNILENEVSKMNPSGLRNQLQEHRSYICGLSYLYESQRTKLYPPRRKVPNSTRTFDISLVELLLNELCPDAPYADERDALREFRNHNYGHISQTNVHPKRFKRLWKELSDILIALGASKTSISKRLEASIDPSQEAKYLKKLKALHERDNELINLLVSLSKDVLGLSKDMKRLLAQRNTTSTGHERHSSLQSDETHPESREAQPQTSTRKFKRKREHPEQVYVDARTSRGPRTGSDSEEGGSPVGGKKTRKKKKRTRKAEQSHEDSARESSLVGNDPHVGKKTRKKKRRTRKAKQSHEDSSRESPLVGNDHRVAQDIHAIQLRQPYSKQHQALQALELWRDRRGRKTCRVKLAQALRRGGFQQTADELDGYNGQDVNMNGLSTDKPTLQWTESTSLGKLPTKVVNTKLGNNTEEKDSIYHAIIKMGEEVFDDKAFTTLDEFAQTVQHLEDFTVLVIKTEENKQTKLSAKVKLEIKNRVDDRVAEVASEIWKRELFNKDDRSTLRKLMDCFKRFEAALRKAELGCVLCHLDFPDVGCYDTFWRGYSDGSLSDTLTRELITDDMRAAEGGADLYIHVRVLDSATEDGDFSDQDPSGTSDRGPPHPGPSWEHSGQGPPAPGSSNHGDDTPTRYHGDGPGGHQVSGGDDVIQVKQEPAEQVPSCCMMGTVKSELDGQFAAIADRLGSMWERLASSLGFNTDYIRDLTARLPPSLRPHQLICDWMERNLGDVTLEQLVQALRDAGIHQIADASDSGELFVTEADLEAAKGKPDGGMHTDRTNDTSDEYCETAKKKSDEDMDTGRLSGGDDGLPDDTDSESSGSSGSHGNMEGRNAHEEGIWFVKNDLKITAQTIQQYLQFGQSLKKITIRSNKFSAGTFGDLSKSLFFIPNVTALVVALKEVNNEDMKQIMIVLSCLHKFKHVDVTDYRSVRRWPGCCLSVRSESFTLQCKVPPNVWQCIFLLLPSDTRELVIEGRKWLDGDPPPTPNYASVMKLASSFSRLERLTKLDLKFLNATAVEWLTLFQGLPLLPATTTSVEGERVKGFPSITILGCSYCNLTSKEILSLTEQLPDLRNLKEIDLSHNYISDEAVFGLGSCQNLRKVNLSFNKLSDRGDFLPPLPSLEEIDLSHNAISDEAVPGLAEGLASCQKLKKVNLSHNKLSDRGDFLPSLPNLEEIDLSHNAISDEAVSGLAEGLGPCQNLKKVNLSYNKLSDRGDFLPPLPNLEEIDFSNNAFCNEAVPGLAEGLGLCQNLKKVNLNYNKLSKVRELAASFINLPILTLVDIQYNAISDESLPAIAAWLKVRTDVERVNLWGNRFSAEGVRDFVRTVKGKAYINREDTLLYDGIQADVGGAVESGGEDVRREEQQWEKLRRETDWIRVKVGQLWVWIDHKGRRSNSLHLMPL
uniref:Death domain-containing protein n=1 Tax=Branchiostoma floridae TaxID=7739 RepID=C3ZPV3_BRAFL|eukprot:XP_002589321.1 hypothetical protein BRAFLDRAFT_77774 [Branchiostoma floridae]